MRVDPYDPVAFADSLARDRPVTPESSRLGQFCTPVSIARFAASRITRLPHGGTARILDPCAGTGTLAVAAALRLADLGARRIHLTAIEIDLSLEEPLHRSLRAAREHLASRGVDLSLDVRIADAIDVAREDPASLTARFDVVIANPPYGRFPRLAPVPGIPGLDAGCCPNIYAAFVLLGNAALAPGGSFVYIVPRSFASGVYFRTFRERLLEDTRIHSVHLFDRRKLPFGGRGVQQETIILAGTREPASVDSRRGDPVRITASRDDRDVERPRSFGATLGDLLVPHGATFALRLPARTEDLEVLRRVDSWPARLADFGLRVSAGAFNAAAHREHLRDGADGGANIPRIFIHHVHRMEIRWPRPELRKPHYVAAEAPSVVVREDADMVLVRRMSAKEDARRLIAAPWLRGTIGHDRIVVDNALLAVYGDTSPPERSLAVAVAAVYSGNATETWVRALCGTTHVNAADLRAMPLPDRTTFEALAEWIAERPCVPDPEEIDARLP